MNDPSDLPPILQRELATITTLTRVAVVGSLIFPLGIAVFVLPRVLRLPLNPYNYNTLATVSFLLCGFGVLTAISSVVCGHRALRLGNYFPARSALRSKIILL